MVKVKFFVVLVFVGALISVSGCDSKPAGEKQDPAPAAKKEEPAKKAEEAGKVAEAPAAVDKEPLRAPTSFDTAQPVGTKAFCPVMKNEFTIDENSTFSEYQGRFIYFCCPGCKPQFDADPEKFLKL